MLLTILSISSSAIPLLFGLSRYQTLPSERKVLVVYFAIAFGGAMYMSYLKHNNIQNLWVANIGTIIDYGFFAYVYSRWELNATVKKIILVSIPLVAIACITLMSYIGNSSEYETYTRPLASIILLLLAAVTLFRLSNEEQSSMVKDARFWISMGIILSFGTTLILFSLASVILELPMQVGRQLFYIHVIVTVLSQLIFAKSFLCQHLESSGQ